MDKESEASHRNILSPPKNLVNNLKKLMKNATFAFYF